MRDIQEFLKENAIDVSVGTATALDSLLKEHVESVRRELEEVHTSEVAFLKEAANKYVDDYVVNAAREAARQFTEENKERLIQTEQFARMQEAFEAVKASIEQNGFKLDNDASTRALNEKLSEANTTIDTCLGRIQSLEESLTRVSRQNKIFEATRDLVATQAEKTQRLLETMSFDSDQEFDAALSLIIETVLKEDKAADDAGEADDKDADKDDDKDADKDDDKDKGDTGTKKLDERVVGYLQRYDVRFGRG